MTGVLCPSIFEYRSLDIPRLKKAGAVVVLSGMGKLRAMYACAELKRRNKGLRHILLIGFAGGLTDNLKVGDVTQPSLFIEQDYFAEPFEKFPNQIRQERSKKILPGAEDVVMLTQDRFLTENPYQKGPYAKKFKKIACDMESYAVAYYGQRSGVPYHVIKLISDSADKNAEHDFLTACKRLAPKLNETVLDAVRSLG